MGILSMELLMADLMVKEALLKVILMRAGFGAPSNHSHSGLIGNFDPLVDVDCMVGMRYVDDGNVEYCRIAFCCVFLYFLSFWSSLICFVSFRFFLVFIDFVNSYETISLFFILYFSVLIPL